MLWGLAYASMPTVAAKCSGNGMKNIPTVNNIAHHEQFNIYLYVYRKCTASIYYTSRLSQRLAQHIRWISSQWVSTSSITGISSQHAVCLIHLLFNQAESFRSGEVAGEAIDDAEKIVFIFCCWPPCCTYSSLCECVCVYAHDVCYVWALKCMYQALNQNQSIHLFCFSSNSSRITVCDVHKYKQRHVKEKKRQTDTKQKTFSSIEWHELE